MQDDGRLMLDFPRGVGYGSHHLTAERQFKLKFARAKEAFEILIASQQQVDHLARRPYYPLRLDHWQS